MRWPWQKEQHEDAEANDWANNDLLDENLIFFKASAAKLKSMDLLSANDPFYQLFVGDKKIFESEPLKIG